MLVIIGESASGKSSVARYLVNNFGFNNIVTYTTREPREGEVNGIDYHFINKLQFEHMSTLGSFAETADIMGGVMLLLKVTMKMILIIKLQFLLHMESDRLEKME